jgi:ribonuclease HII
MIRTVDSQEARRARVRRGPAAILIAGVDEAGRGPLAGPVAAAAVILDPCAVPTGLADSKVLTFAERERLYEEIKASAIAVSIAFSGPATIDRVNIRVATLDAMRRAITGLAVRPAIAEIDGKDVPPDLGCDATAIIDGDALVPAISAASIIAKVARDRLMIRLGSEFPHYGFEQHMGYATTRHLAAIEEYGPTPHHRLSFGILKVFGPT